MKNKNYFIFIIIFLIIVVLFFLIYFLQDSNNSFSGQDETLEDSQGVLKIDILDNDFVEEVNLTDDRELIPELFDVNKIVEPKELDASQKSILESPRFSIPKDISGIEMMSQEEKESLGIDPELDVQVLGRTENGQPTGYQFIYSEEDFILDLE
jgi:hypothetical protein